MAHFTKYLVTVDTDSGAIAKIQRLGAAGDLVDVDPTTLPWARPAAGAGPSVVINVYAGGTGGPQTTVVSSTGSIRTESVSAPDPGGEPASAPDPGTESAHAPDPGTEAVRAPDPGAEPMDDQRPQAPHSAPEAPHAAPEAPHAAPEAPHA